MASAGCEVTEGCFSAEAGGAMAGRAWPPNN